jgi:glutaredoxin
MISKSGFSKVPRRGRLVFMMTLIRFVLGKIILTWDALFRPAALVRDPKLQLQFDAETKDWRLYQLLACPFCVKVRRELTRLSIQIPTKEVKESPEAFQELMAGGKEDQVPCLMVPGTEGKTEWLYESSEIISFLRKRFGPVQN